MTTVGPSPEDKSQALMQIYQAIGYFVSQWSLAEELLYIIYYRAARLPEFEFAEDFFAIDSYPMRSKLITSAIRQKYWRDKNKCQYWESKIKSLNEFYKFRNYVAHNPIHAPQLRIDATVPSGEGRIFITHDYLVFPTFYSSRGGIGKDGVGFLEIVTKGKKLAIAIASLRKEIPRDFPENLQNPL